MENIVVQIEELKKLKSVEAIINFDEKLDHFFGIDVSCSEKNVNLQDPDAYQGLDSRALQTSYIDYYTILKRVPKGEILVDLGAGYCRGSLISYLLNMPKCMSYEFQISRTLAARKYLGTDECIIHADLKEEKFLQAHSYYLYFPKGIVLDKILTQLIHYSHIREVHLYVCESHGDVMAYLDHLIGSREDEFSASLPRHYQNIVHYKIDKINFNISRKDNLALWTLFNKDKYLVVQYYSAIRNEEVEWIIPIFDLSWIFYHGHETLQTKTGRILLLWNQEKVIGVEDTFDYPNITRTQKVLRKEGIVFIE